VTKLAVSEVFHSIQGEGLLAGAPSTFIRLAFCNLSCSWCDAAYTWKGKVENEEYTALDLALAVQHQRVVITGGEPTFAEGFDELVRVLDEERGAHITVETNGTIFRPQAVEHVDLWSVSPKFGTSGQTDQLRPTQLLRYFHLVPQGAMQLKFVVDGEDDFQATLGFLRDFDPPEWVPVFMQPNGLCHIAAVRIAKHVSMTDTTPTAERAMWVPDENEREPDDEGKFVAASLVTLETPYLDRLRWLYERVVEADRAGDLPRPVRVLPQTHKLAWGNKRGF
jgi:7-carboxy-7-deazaguanine synthase